MKNYKVSDIANLAKVSKRTIQFYDEKDVLKPSYIDKSGYRYYSEDKLLQLQKILALKYLGLSLNDIKTILMDDDSDVVNSLLLQKNLINQKVKYDAVIANHVLYFAEDINKVIKNITKLSNVFYTTAYSKNQMVETRNIVKEFDNSIKLTNDKYFDKFDVTKAKEILNKHYKSVEYVPYLDYLEVNKVDALVDYVLSCNGNQNQYLQKRLSQFRIFLDYKKTITITKDAGIFICKNNS